MPSQDEFLKLFLVHQREIRAFVAAAVRDPHARDDIFQETALALWKTFDRYDPARPFDTWARGVARNMILRHRRKSGSNLVLLEPEALEAVAIAYDETREEDDSYTEALRNCMEKTPVQTRRLLDLRYQQSLSLAEIGKRVHSNTNAVNQALVRARLALQACIENRLAMLNKEGDLPT